MSRFSDPLFFPGTGEGPAERLKRAQQVAGTLGEAYLQKRKVPLVTAEAAGVCYEPDLVGRPALLVPLRDAYGRVTALHGRYLQVRRGQNKMFTFGAAGGVIEALDGVQAAEPIVVEGLFDALSVASCGWPCVATIGRWAPWLAEIWTRRTVWLAFDTGRPGEAEVELYRSRLRGCRLRRLPPPPRCKDWNTALVKKGAAVVNRWIRESVSAGGEEP